MVVWVFAGGGETEVAGLIKFLQMLFPQNFVFVRKTPFDSTKKGAKPNRKSTLGITGKSLIQAIKKYLPLALLVERNKPNLILVVDDLDCCDLENQRQSLLDCIDQISGTENIEKYIAFAAPEIEVWIMADWEHTIAKSAKFRNRQKAMVYWLSTQKQFPFDQPENFGEYDPKGKACKEKLSELLISASSQTPEDQGKEYKKSEDSSELLLRIEKTILCLKCPIFRHFYNFMQTLNTN